MEYTTIFSAKQRSGEGETAIARGHEVAAKATAGRTGDTALNKTIQSLCIGSLLIANRKIIIII
jgi:hypothetical protein